jgi:ATP-dependent Clp protease ATP-binding subunit ClpA
LFLYLKKISGEADMSQPHKSAARARKVPAAASSAPKPSVSNRYLNPFLGTGGASFLSGAGLKPNESALEKYGRDMTATAANMDPVIGRDDEIDRVVCTLCRRTKNSAVLVGEPGVGKTAIAEGLAQRIAAGAVPAAIAGARVVEIDICRMVAGTVYRGM